MYKYTPRGHNTQSDCQCQHRHKLIDTSREVVIALLYFHYRHCHRNTFFCTNKIVGL